MGSASPSTAASAVHDSATPCDSAAHASTFLARPRTEAGTAASATGGQCRNSAVACRWPQCNSRIFKQAKDHKTHCGAKHGGQLAPRGPPLLASQPPLTRDPAADSRMPPAVATTLPPTMPSNALPKLPAATVMPPAAAPVPTALVPTTTAPGARAPLLTVRARLDWHKRQILSSAPAAGTGAADAWGIDRDRLGERALQPHHGSSNVPAVPLNPHKRKVEEVCAEASAPEATEGLAVGLAPGVTARGSPPPPLSKGHPPLPEGWVEAKNPR